ncbi:hypothetical protein LTR64_006503 [Lithohypha guttulata]|uniref:uncharacterized protein n=1 Tax=Lithohypha guttulata TaxID=1690604 RepID=UPI00315C7BC6
MSQSGVPQRPAGRLSANGRPISSRRQNLSCPHCPTITYSNPEDLRSHMRSQHGAEKLRCNKENCGKEFPHKSNLTRHINLDHADPNKEVCIVTRKDHLRRHTERCSFKPEGADGRPVVQTCTKPELEQRKAQFDRTRTSSSAGTEADQDLLLQGPPAPAPLTAAGAPQEPAGLSQHFIAQRPNVFGQHFVDQGPAMYGQPFADQAMYGPQFFEQWPAAYNQQVFGQEPAIYNHHFVEQDPVIFGQPFTQQAPATFTEMLFAPEPAAFRHQTVQEEPQEDFLWEPAAFLQEPVEERPPLEDLEDATAPGDAAAAGDMLLQQPVQQRPLHEDSGYFSAFNSPESADLTLPQYNPTGSGLFF